MIEPTYGTIEEYGALDWLLWADIPRDTIPYAKWLDGTIQYNQNEFKDHSYYCTAYMCFSVYTSFTWLEVSKELRKEFVNICLDEELIVEGVGWYLNRVFTRRIKFLHVKTGIKYNWFRVEMWSKEAAMIKAKKYAIGTWFKTSAVFNKDKDDNCTIDSVESVGSGKAGHALADCSNGVRELRQDNYFWLAKCNIYEIIKEVYDYFVTNKQVHFTYGYFMTLLTDMTVVSQQEQDQKDLEWAIANGITNGKELDRAATRREIAIMMARQARLMTENKTQ